MVVESGNGLINLDDKAWNRGNVKKNFEWHASSIICLSTVRQIRIVYEILAQQSYNFSGKIFLYHFIYLFRLCLCYDHAVIEIDSLHST